MAIPPVVVNAAKKIWHWQWNQLMNGLAPSDNEGNYTRPPSQHKKATILSKDSLSKRSTEQLPRLIIGRSCPWAHRTWLVHQIKYLQRIMTYDTELYYAVQTFLEDDELCKIWNIIEIAMNREGYDVSNAELSMRLYDNELEENIEHDMENLL